MTLATTALYSCLIAILYIILETRVSITRGKTNISIHAGESVELGERIRQHGNLTEHAPIALILLGLVEMNNASPVWLHSIGGILLVARILHPFGVKADNLGLMPRLIGAVGTTVSMVIAIVFLMWSYLG